MTASNKGEILWVDDEIELLRSHIMFLEDRGYKVTPMTNADDAIALIREANFDIVLLDEMMPGKDGLTALAEIKDVHPSLPVVMVTKNEEEALMEDAIGSKIDDYLTKPVNPSQILLICKKILERKKITGERISRDYIFEFNKISQMLMGPLTHEEWIEIYSMLCEWEIETDKHRGLGLKQTLRDQMRGCNAEFGKFIQDQYPHWINSTDERPRLSIDIVNECVVPLLGQNRQVVFLVLDNLRLDQWLILEPLLYSHFNIKKEIYFSILPTATPFSRNAIFSGLFPAEIEARYPELWSNGVDDDLSLNRYEHQLLDHQLTELGVRLKPESKYIKILDVNEASNVASKISTYSNIPLLAIVVNFVDILAHSRSDSEVLREITPDESAYRSLTKSWFEHSYVFQILAELSRRQCTVVITSDHGSVLGMRGAKVIGDRETSTNLRYKFGKNLKVDAKHAIIVKDPATYKLPSRGINSNYLIAKEDYYFVYPTNYHHYLNYFKDSFQHGGVSMEEMILPVVTLEPKK
ncbi:bifunctional response regulator/alkaline phosphatase family protein [bacterium]|nr:bifunctional response regulator/alkaline phosphatase family protein [bacterium]